MTRSSILRLSDGRVLGYLEYGDPAGRPLFLCHGFLGSRLDRHPDDALTAALGVRMIALDRPGIGLSTPQRNRDIAAWPDDIVALADSLGINRFAVLGFSWGAPYALACAYRIPDRVSAIGLVSPMPYWIVGAGASKTLPPRFKRLSRIVQVAPVLLYVGLWVMYLRRRRDPRGRFTAIMARFSPQDVAAIERVGLRPLLYDAFAEPWRQGVGGVYRDLLAVARPWRFDPRSVTAEVRLWHGAEDRIIRPAMANALADILQCCHATVYPDEGHFVLFAHWAEILQTLTATVSAES